MAQAIPIVARSLGLLSNRALSALSRALFSRSWARFLEATRDPARVQEEKLAQLLFLHQDTTFGREHRFSGVRGAAAFRAGVPVRNYAAFEPYLLRMLSGEADVLVPGKPFFYARSSGTGGAPKHIPVTRNYVAEFRLPRRVWMRQVAQVFPGILRGKILTMHSPRIEGHTSDGTPYGSITAAMTGSPGSSELPDRSLGMDPGPRSLFLLEDFQLKYALILRFAAQERISLAAAINPSTLVLLFKKLDQGSDRLIEELKEGTFAEIDKLTEPLKSEVRSRLRKDPGAAERIRRSRADHGRVLPGVVWPDLVGLLSWKGGSAPFYLGQLEKLLPGIPIMDYGFVATEGGFSIPLSPEGSKGVAAVTGHLLEFLPEGETDGKRAVFADQLEAGQRYRILISGSHGLMRYDINDIVECQGHFQNTAEIAFLHKGGNMLSITGEKIAESQAVLAVTSAEQETGIPLSGFCLSMEVADPPRYVFAVEPQCALDDREAILLLEACERALQKANIEYAAKRDSERLGPPKLALLRPGSFERERARRVAAGAPDSHIKPPHLAPSLAALEALEVERAVESKR